MNGATPVVWRPEQLGPRRPTEGDGDQGTLPHNQVQNKHSAARTAAALALRPTVAVVALWQVRPVVFGPCKDTRRDQSRCDL